MSNHGNDYSAIDERMKQLAENLKLGATGKYPEGKLTPSDQGEIAISVGETDGKVVLNFGKDISWIGFPARQAIELARSISDHANSILAKGN